MTDFKSQEKKQSIWSLAIALSVVVTIFAPQDVLKQNTIPQTINELAQNTLNTVIDGEFN